MEANPSQVSSSPTQTPPPDDNEAGVALAYLLISATCWDREMNPQLPEAPHTKAAATTIRAYIASLRSENAALVAATQVQA